MGELGENAAEIDLPVAQRSEPPRPVDPVAIAAIDARTAGRIELGILDVEHADAVVVEVDELQIIHRLQHEMTGVIEDVGTPMAAHRLQEPLERHTVMQVLARMQLVAEVDALFLERIQDRPPALAELGEPFRHQSGGPLRPGIDERPEQRAREGRMSL